MNKLKNLEIRSEKFSQKTAQLFIEKNIKPVNIIYWTDDDIVTFVAEEKIAKK